MTELRYWTSSLKKDTSPQIFISLPMLTHIDILIQKDHLNPEIPSALAHCKLVRNLRLECQPDKTSHYYEKANTALSHMFGQMKDIESIELVIPDGLSSQCVSHQYAPHLAQTLKTLKLGKYQLPIPSHPFNLTGIKHLRSLTSLGIFFVHIEPVGRELQEIFDSLVSLTHIQFVNRLQQLSDILDGPLEALVNSRIASHLRQIHPISVLMDIQPSRYHHLSQLVSLESLIIRRLEGDASFIRDMRGLRSLSIGVCDHNFVKGAIFDEKSKKNNLLTEQYKAATNKRREEFMNIIVDSSTLVNQISQLCWLRELELSELKDFASHHLNQLLPSLTSLIKLKLMNLPKLIDISILFRRRDTLRELSLDSLPQLLPMSLDTIRQLVGLRHLGMVDCMSVRLPWPHPPHYLSLTDFPSLPYLETLSVHQRESDIDVCCYNCCVSIDSEVEVIDDLGDEEA